LLFRNARVIIYDGYVFVNNILEKISNSLYSSYLIGFCEKMSLKWEEPAGTIMFLPVEYEK